MSNNTSTGGQTSPTTPASSDNAASDPPANPTSTAPPLDTSTSVPTPTSTTPTAPASSSSTPVPPTTTSTTPAPPPTTTSSTPTSSSTTSSTPPPTTTAGGTTSTIVTIITSTQEVSQTPGASTTSASTTSSATPINPNGESGSGGLNTNGKIAVGVVVPIAAVALLVLAGLFFWRKHKAKKAADEERRKEVEDYAYNPNADPTVPAVGVVGDGPYEMKEDGSTGYRGWGTTTVAGSTGRKASTTISGGGMTGPAYSDATSPTRGNISDTRSGEPLVDGSQHGSYSPEGEILGAMGPSAAANRGGDVRRGPSNASSSYSAAARSDGSGEGIGVAIGGANPYYEQYGSHNPYSDQGYGPQRQELPGQPVIRDNPARRNTRIENPSHYPQQSAGISQNF